MRINRQAVFVGRPLAPGTWQQYLVAPEAALLPVADNVSDEAAAQFFVRRASQDCGAAPVAVSVWMGGDARRIHLLTPRQRLRAKRYHSRLPGQFCCSSQPRCCCSSQLLCFCLPRLRGSVPRLLLSTASLFLLVPPAKINPVTAVGFFRVLDVPKGEWLLSNAASSTLGRMVIQLGKKWVSGVGREEGSATSKATFCVTNRFVSYLAIPWHP